MPNSIIQGLTTATPAGLNRLDPFPMTVLLGLLTMIDPRHPDRDVCARPSDVLEVIAVGKSVAHAVDREWETQDGPRRKRYRARRYNPKHMRLIHEALLLLHDQKVAVQRRDAAGKAKLDDRVVHVLDMFGYSYVEDGRALDIDDLPPGKTKVNVGNPDRPVWRLKERSTAGDRDVRPKGVLFRLNKELADELVGARGSIGFTLMARRVFGVLREFHREPAAIRLLLLVVRQTGTEVVRRLNKTIEELGWDPEHKGRSVARLAEALTRLKELRIVLDFEVDELADRVRVTRNQGWYEEAELGLAAVG